jgi:serine/threonine protein kinase/tetratricopeptide (TPR) repeat protein
MNDLKADAKAIFLEALDQRGSDELIRFLDQACGADAALRGRVEELLRAHHEAGNFLGRPDLPEITQDQPVSERPGTIIGPYKLLEQIGEGGFGVVFMAEQQQPIRRKVALKVLKPGMDTRQVIARFEAERQALALMDHPNIAKVLDAGAIGESEPAALARANASEPAALARDACRPLAHAVGSDVCAGRPYFVMELVRGIPITEYCDQNQLTPRERLELFIHVCQAVQHAHQKGIIHRDIKPTNVLVTLQDGTPLVKVIDFGIAKAMGQQLTDKTLFTNFAQLIGTPLYMSPEQAALSNVDVDTRSDIYSLGVLLYELLTGTTPFDKERFKEVGYDEMRRIIREEEPPKPSTRVSTLGRSGLPSRTSPARQAGPASDAITTNLATIAAQRKSDPKRLSQLFRGELDWIVMKALDKDRNRRYETASAFAADVQRYLQDEPVQACPPSAMYRFRKFTRRNKTVLGFATSLFLVVALVAIGLAVNNHLIVQEQSRTDKAYKRAQANLGLALETLDEIYMQVAEQRLPRDPQSRQEDQQLLEKAVGFYERFAEENRDDPAVGREVCSAYRRAGQLFSYLGDQNRAKEAYVRQGEAAARFAAEFPAEPFYRAELAMSYYHLGRVLEEERDRTAVEQYRYAFDIWDQLAKDFPDVPLYRRYVACAHTAFGHMLEQGGEWGAATERYRQVVDLMTEVVRQRPTFLKYCCELANAHKDLGRARKEEGDWVAARRHYEEAVKIMTQVVADCPAVHRNPPELKYNKAPTLHQIRGDLAICHIELAELLREDGDPEEAQEHYRHALHLDKELNHDCPAIPKFREDMAVCLISLGFLFHEDGQWTSAETHYVEAIDLLKKLVNDYPDMPDYQVDLARAHRNVASLLVDLGRPQDADKAVNDALVLSQQLTKERPGIPDYQEELATVWLLLGDLRGALHRSGEAKEAWHKFLELAPDTAQAREKKAWFLATCPDEKFLDPAQAVLLAKKAVHRAPRSRHALQTFGVASYRVGEWKAAADALNESKRSSKSGDAASLFFLAMTHWQRGDKKQAGKCYDQAVQALEKNQPNQHELRRFRAEAEALLEIKKQPAPKE